MLEYELDLIQKSEIRTDPFPHLIIDDFLNDTLYETVLKYFPSTDQLVQGGEFSKQLDLVVDPGVARADESWGFERHMKGTQLNFWSGFKEALFDYPLIGDALLEKFQMDSKDRYMCGRIQVEGKGSGLGPHRDRFDKLISCVIYLDECLDACGTKLLAPKILACLGLRSI